MTLKLSTLITALILSIQPAWSMESAGVQMPDTLKVGDKDLVLNGMGIRKAFMTVKVYVAGLYLEKKSQDPEEIMKSPGVKHLAMEFKTNVEKAKLNEAWETGYTGNCTENCAAGKDSLKKLTSMMEDMREKQKMSFAFYPTKLEVEVKGAKKGTIEGAELSKNLLAIFLGKNPPNGGLKDGLLGK